MLATPLQLAVDDRARIVNGGYAVSPYLTCKYMRRMRGWRPVTRHVVTSCNLASLMDRHAGGRVTGRHGERRAD